MASRATQSALNPIHPRSQQVAIAAFKSIPARWASRRIPAIAVSVTGARLAFLITKKSAHNFSSTPSGRLYLVGGSLMVTDGSVSRFWDCLCGKTVLFPGKFGTVPFLGLFNCPVFGTVRSPFFERKSVHRNLFCRTFFLSGFDQVTALPKHLNRCHDGLPILFSDFANVRN